MEWFPGRLLGRSKPKVEASVFVRSRSAARPVLTEVPQTLTVTRTPRETRTTKRQQQFAGFDSPPGKF